MFGHQDESKTEPVNDDQPVIAPTEDTAAVDAQAAPEPASSVTPATMPDVPSDVDDTPDPIPPTSAPAVEEDTDDTPLPTVADSATDNDALLDIKQQALQELSPLVGHLDQSPEEKFRTTMMMIQASDNQELLKDAFEAANKITDDKTRAQALLDVINEINYFTQHNGE